MDLWIGMVSGSGGRELRIEGRLVGEGLAELERVTRSAEGLARIDLSQLYSADDAGIGALRWLASAGIDLVGARPLIQYRLDEEPEDSNRGS